jgi:hypothetical protein
MRTEIFGINGQLRNKLFLIVVHRFSLAKAGMNAVHLCNLHRECLACICHGAMVLTKGGGSPAGGGGKSYLVHLHPAEFK